MAASRRGEEDSEHKRHPRVAHQATVELNTDEVDRVDTAEAMASIDTPDQPPMAPRQLEQSTKELDIESAQREADLGVAATHYEPAARSRGPEAPHLPALASNPTIAADDDAGSTEQLADHTERNNSNDWPPMVADYQGGGEAGETVEEARGVSARDLANIFGYEPPLSAPGTEPATPDGVGADPWAPQTPEPPGRARTTNRDRQAWSGSIEPALDEGVVSSATTTAAHTQVEEHESASAVPVNEHETASVPGDKERDTVSTDHVKMQSKRPSSKKVIVLAAVAALALFGIVGGVLYWLFDLSAITTLDTAPEAARVTSSLLIRTTPDASCTVFIDKKPTGLVAPGTPLLIGDLSAGQCQVSVRCIGFAAFDRTIALEVGKVAVIRAQLARDGVHSASH